MNTSTPPTDGPSAASMIHVLRLGLWCALLFGLLEGTWMTWARAESSPIR